MDRVVAVTKRLIELDDELLTQAQRELGTSGVSDTVRAALRHAAAASARAGAGGRVALTAKGKPYYRCACAATHPDYAAPAVPGHPPTYMVREERITAALDGWLELLTSPTNLDDTVSAVLAADAERDTEPVEVSAARRRQQQLTTELDRMLAAIRAGMDPQPAAGETRKIQAELGHMAAVIEQSERGDQRMRPAHEAAHRATGTGGDRSRRRPSGAARWI